jgi:hypothetical protein
MHQPATRKQRNTKRGHLLALELVLDVFLGLAEDLGGELDVSGLIHSMHVAERRCDCVPVYVYDMHIHAHV